MLISFAVVVIAMGVSSIAPNFELLIVARVIVALGHSAYWSVAGAYAAYLVPPERLGRATAITAGGGSVAGILGGPTGNALGQLFGWRLSFAVFAVFGILVLVLLGVFLPNVSGADGNQDIASRPEKIPKSVLLICAVLLMLVLSQNFFTTYLVPWLKLTSDFTAMQIPIYLMASGVSGAIGVTVVGMLSDRFPRATLLGAIGVLVTVLFMLPPASGTKIYVILLGCLMSASFSMIPPLLQAMLMRRSSSEIRANVISIQTTAINIGIGGGAFLGGLAFEAHLFSVMPWISALGGSIAFIVLCIAVGKKRI